MRNCLFLSFTNDENLFSPGGLVRLEPVGRVRPVGPFHTKCGETVYYGQHTRISVTRQQYHTYSCPTPEMNAILRALAAEYEDSEIYEDSDSETAAREVARARRLRF